MIVVGKLKKQQQNRCAGEMSDASGRQSYLYRYHDFMRRTESVPSLPVAVDFHRFTTSRQFTSKKYTPCNRKNIAGTVNAASTTSQRADVLLFCYVTTSV